MKTLYKTVIIILSIFVVSFPVSGSSITKKYVTTDNIVRVVYVATHLEILVKKELNHRIFEVYGLISETVFGEP